MQVPTANNLMDVDPSNDPAYNPNYPGRAPWTRLVSGNSNNGNNNGVLIPWCGTAYDDATGDVYLPLGGGHANYGGNEPYKLTLGADVPRWYMIRPPSGSVPLIAGGLPAGSTPQGNSYLLDDGSAGEISGVYADGRPRAIHSYRRHIWVPGIGVVMSVQGSTFSNVGVSTKSTWTMNSSTGEWTFRVEPSPSFGPTSGGGACYDSKRNLIYFARPGTDKVMKLDPTTWTWSQLTNSITNSGNAAVLYAADLDRVIWVGGAGNVLRVINPDTGAVSTPTMDTPPTPLLAAMGLDWVEGRGLIFHQHDIATAAVYQLNPPANPESGNWTVTALATTGSPTGDANSVGWWSRFLYSKKLKGFYRIVSYDMRPWFLPLE
jgi:hypothetical protein